MIFYGSFNARPNLNEGPIIDFIEFSFSKADPVFLSGDLGGEGEVVLPCDWESSDWEYDSETGGGYFRCKGVCVNQRYANGHLEMFKNAVIDTLQVYASDDAEFELTALSVCEGESIYALSEENIRPKTIEYVE